MPGRWRGHAGNARLGLRRGKAPAGHAASCSYRFLMGMSSSSWLKNSVATFRSCHNQFIQMFLLGIAFSMASGCLSTRDVAITRLPSEGFYEGSVVPLSSNAKIDSTVSKEELQYFQKALASERDGGSATIDSVFRFKGDGGDVVEVRRQVWYWRFRKSSDGHWLLVAHGTWFG